MSGTSPYRYYAAEISYFSGKARPALRFKDIPFEEIAPTPEIFRQVILPRTGLAFIPVLETPDGEILQDTSFILDELERRHPQPPLYPATPVQRVVAYLLELYADEFGVLPAMHYRWSFAESEAKARRDFAAATGNGESSSQFADRMKGSLPMLGVTPESIPGIEAHLRELLDALSDLFAEQPYLLGTCMSLGDCGGKEE
jgi:glutathione S-transferase